MLVESIDDNSVDNTGLYTLHTVSGATINITVPDNDISRMNVQYNNWKGPKLKYKQLSELIKGFMDFRAPEGAKAAEASKIEESRKAEEVRKSEEARNSEEARRKDEGARAEQQKAALFAKAGVLAAPVYTPAMAAAATAALSESRGMATGRAPGMLQMTTQSGGVMATTPEMAGALWRGSVGVAAASGPEAVAAGTGLLSLSVGAFVIGFCPSLQR